jgi:hypothetical protein
MLVLEDDAYWWLAWGDRPASTGATSYAAPSSAGTAGLAVSGGPGATTDLAPGSMPQAAAAAAAATGPIGKGQVLRSGVAGAERWGGGLGADAAGQEAQEILAVAGSEPPEQGDLQGWYRDLPRSFLSLDVDGRVLRVDTLSKVHALEPLS